MATTASYCTGCRGVRAFTSTFGAPTVSSLCVLSACTYVWLTRVSNARSSSASMPRRFSMTSYGTCPLRNPGTEVFSPYSFAARLRYGCTSSHGTSMDRETRDFGCFFTVIFMYQSHYFYLSHPSYLETLFARSSHCAPNSERLRQRFQPLLCIPRLSWTH